MSQVCEQCGSTIQSGKGVYFSHTGTIPGELFCTECYNRQTAEELGVDYQPFESLTFRVYDKVDERNRSFKIERLLHPFGVKYEAFEQTESGYGYMFAVGSKGQVDEEALLEELKKKVQEGIHCKFLSEYQAVDHTYTVINGDEINGTLASDPSDAEWNTPLLVIDGKTITWAEFGRLIMAFEGCKFDVSLYEADKEELGFGFS